MEPPDLMGRTPWEETLESVHGRLKRKGSTCCRCPRGIPGISPRSWSWDVYFDRTRKTVAAEFSRSASALPSGVRSRSTPRLPGLGVSMDSTSDMHAKMPTVAGAQGQDN